MTMLRLISFGMDYHWAITQGLQKEVDRILFDPATHSDRQVGELRNLVPQATDEQSPSTQVVYLLELPRIHSLPSFVHCRSHRYV